MDRRSAPVDPTQLAAYFALIEVTSLLRHAIEQQLAEAGELTFVQFQALRRLDAHADQGSQRMTDLADSVVLSRSGMTYQVGLLEKRGLVTRGATPGDDRGVSVTITDAGRELIAAVMPGHVDVVSRMLFDPLSRTDAEVLAGLLEPVRDHMRAAPPRSAAPRRRRSAGT